MLTTDGAAFMLHALFCPLDGWTIRVTDGVQSARCPVGEMSLEPIANGAIAHLRGFCPKDALEFASTSSELISPDGVVVDTCSGEAVSRRPTALERRPEWDFEWVVDHAVTLAAKGPGA